MVTMNVKATIEPNTSHSIRIFMRHIRVFTNRLEDDGVFSAVDLPGESFPIKLLFLCRYNTGMFHYQTDNPDLDLKIKTIHNDSSGIYYESRELTYDEVANGFDFTCLVRSLKDDIWKDLNITRNPIDLNNHELNGSLELILYNTLDGENVINKTLTNRTPIEITFKSNVDILSPEILLLDDGNYSQFNYCHIPLFNRYYYCEGYERVSANLIKLSFDCDVIETYKHDIMTSHANYNRKIGVNDYLNIPVDHSIRTESILYHSNKELSGQSMILTSLGG